MANMSYCRFENTYHDLQDCLEHLNDNNLSNTEKKYRDRLILTCENIINEQEVEEVEEVENESEDEIIESEVVDGKNIERKENFNQVCVWPGTIVGKEKIKEFEEWMLKEFDTRVQYLEEIKTYPDKENGKELKETGDRNDVFFAVHEDDVGKFALSRLKMGIRWIEDVLAKGNYKNEIYPNRVFNYKTW